MCETGLRGRQAPSRDAYHNGSAVGAIGVPMVPILHEVIVPLTAPSHKEMILTSWSSPSPHALPVQ